MYVDLLVKYAKLPANSKTIEMNKNEYLQYLDMKKRVSEEVAEFLKFLQNSAKKCAQDYNMLSEEARLFTQRMFRACFEQVKTYPEFYSLHEVTSLMGFFPFRTEMGLKLEKTLLVLGNVKFVKTVFPSMPVKLQLSKDDQPPVETAHEKVEALRCDISKDVNAEKLVSRYRPHIVLTSQSLFTLLNNHGPGYREQWEIPVTVQLIPVAGSKPVKVIYINSPLPQKQMTMRERNQVFHEVPLRYLISKSTSVPVSAVFMDKPEECASEGDTSNEVNECRKLETLENMDLGFDDDVTELETFGVTATNPSRSPSPPRTSPGPSATNKPTVPRPAAAPVAPVTPAIPTTPVTPEDSRSLSQMLMKQLQKEKQLFCSVESGSEECRSKDGQGPLSAGERDRGPSAESLMQDGQGHPRQDTPQAGSTTATENALNSNRATDTGGSPRLERSTDASEELAAPLEAEAKAVLCGSDVDEDCLVIDTDCKSKGDGETAGAGSRTPSPKPSGQASTATATTATSTPATPTTSTPTPATATATTACSPEESCVLKKPIKRVYKKFDPVGEILKMQDELLKPVSKKGPELPPMNLDDAEQPPASEQTCTASEAPGWPQSTWPSAFQKPKGRLPYELQDYVEDTSEYLAPPEGNFVYKLFSLQDLLLLVRCSIQKIETRPRSKKRKKIRRQFPVYVLPKVEYQGCYGAEALTESELCRLWTESLLHSNSSFYVGHIDAFTSKLFLLEEITSEELKEKLSALKISSLFNILQHILKKLSSLQEGSYLLSHAAEDSSLLIYKASDGKPTRTAYNLHKAHGDLPVVPSSLSVPWVPLEPSCLLPYHIHHGRIPCTFPPKSARPAAQLKVAGAKMPTKSHGNPVPMETKSSGLPVQQVENGGAAPGKRKMT
nr:little elongation complex subunit 2 isoform X2 [Jaculus jaculus]